MQFSRYVASTSPFDECFRLRYRLESIRGTIREVQGFSL